MSHLSSRVRELKSQGAADAARDPNGTVSPEDAEKIMTDESTKAGVAAYRFDPNASPEDKAAQVRSVRPSISTPMSKWYLLTEID